VFSPDSGVKKNPIESAEKMYLKQREYERKKHELAERQRAQEECSFTPQTNANIQVKGDMQERNREFVNRKTRKLRKQQEIDNQ
jgi:hypothetical protein